MLQKLLKYDFKFIFRYWVIGALISLVMSLAGGGCIILLSSDKDLPTPVDTAAILIIVMVVISFIAFLILSLILTFIRFYKNFFSDEGYLTFTLPVKTSTLLASKTIVGVAATVSTTLVMVLDLFLMLWIGIGNDVPREIGELFADAYRAIGPVLTLYIIEGLLVFLAGVVFTVLFTYACITFASIITKKARVITAIGIYYGANSVITFLKQMFFIFGVQSLGTWLGPLSEDSIKLSVALLLFALIAFVTMFCGLMYLLDRYMLDRKLNLA